MDTTILAAKEEEERMIRLNEKHSQLTELISLLSPKKAESVGGPSLVLDFDIGSKSPLVTVHPALVKILKPHQVDIHYYFISVQNLLYNVLDNIILILYLLTLLL